jgi:chromate transport protein ChrA
LPVKGPAVIDAAGVATFTALAMFDSTKTRDDVCGFALFACFPLLLINKKIKQVLVLVAYLLLLCRICFALNL